MPPDRRSRSGSGPGRFAVHGFRNALRIARIALVTGFVLAGALVAAPAAGADEAAMRRAAERLFPGHKVDSIRPLGKGGLHEVYIHGNVLYMDARAEVVLVGTLFDGNTLRNLSHESEERLSRIDFSTLPLDLAVRRVHGKGRRVLAVFADPNCQYCRAYEKELAAIDDVTIYMFLYPVIAPDSASKVAAIWCAPDRAAAWREWAKQGSTPAAPERCDSPHARVLALGEKLWVGITPTTFLATGKRLRGVIPAATLEAELRASARR